MADKIPTSPVFYNKQDEPKKQGFQNKPDAPTAPVFYNTPAERKPIDYTDAYNDMVKDPQKYYNAYNGNITQYNNMLNFTGYMSAIKSRNLPEQYTRYAEAYGELFMNPTKYTEIFGGTAAYKAGLQSTKELFGIENQTTGHLMDLMDKSSVPNWTGAITQAPELGQMFQYDPTNPDDILLQSVGYAPTSFSDKFSQSKIEKMQQEGYSADEIISKANADQSNYVSVKIPFGNTVTADQVPVSAYLSMLYTYDLTDPEDVMNKALGLMPKSFKYDNTDEDVARKSQGLLPKYADDYVKNSERFNVEYLGYAQAMQEYADEMADWQYGPNTGFLGWFKGEKPKAPYVPETVAAVMEYKDLLTNGNIDAEYQTPYEKFTEGKAKGPKELPFYTGDLDSLPLFVDPENPDIDAPGYFKGSSQISDTGRIKKELQAQGGGLIKYLEQQKNDGSLTEEQYNNLVMQIAGSQGNLPLDEAAGMIYENDFIQGLKDAGTYESYKAESDKIYDDMVAVLTEGRNPNYEAEMTEENKTIGSFQAYKTRKWTTNPEDTYTPEKAEILKKNLGLVSEFVDQPITDGWAAIRTNGVTPEIREKLKSMGLTDDDIMWAALGYTEKDYDELAGAGLDAAMIDKIIGWADNPEVQYQFEKGAYIATIKEYRNRMVTVDNMKNAPSWLVAIGNGLHNGVSNVGDNLLGLSLEIGKLNPFQDERSREGLDSLADYVAQSGQYRRGAYVEEIEAAQGGNTWATSALFNITSTATELGITLGAGKVLSAAGGVSNAAKAVTGWRGLANKILFNKELVPMFMSSLGGNLMQGELKGYDGLTNWLVALPTAYFEAKTESMFGFFSKSGSAFKMFKNGIKNLPLKT
ncbi:MAG: hypothetical protein WC374_14085, partial [Phycisphaerae bacterium]